MGAEKHVQSDREILLHELLLLKLAIEERAKRRVRASARDAYIEHLSQVYNVVAAQIDAVGMGLVVGFTVHFNQPMLPGMDGAENDIKEAYKRRTDEQEIPW